VNAAHAQVQDLAHRGCGLVGKGRGSKLNAHRVNGMALGAIGTAPRLGSARTDAWRRSRALFGNIGHNGWDSHGLVKAVASVAAMAHGCRDADA